VQCRTGKIRLTRMKKILVRKKESLARSKKSLERIMENQP
jgi:hypothetical protein